MPEPEQIKQCQKPEGYLHHDNSKGMGRQLFCTVCKRWQFKARRCELFKRGKQ